MFIGTGHSLLVYLPLSPFISVNVSPHLQTATLAAQYSSLGRMYLTSRTSKCIFGFFNFITVDEISVFQISVRSRFPWFWRPTPWFSLVHKWRGKYDFRSFGTPGRNFLWCINKGERRKYVCHVSLSYNTSTIFHVMSLHVDIHFMTLHAATFECVNAVLV